MSARQVLSATGDVALQLLRLTAASADVFPPLKSAAAGALHIAELVKGFKSNKEHWQALGTYVEDATASVMDSLTQEDELREATKANLKKLEAALKGIEDAVKAERAARWYKRAGSYLQDPDKVAGLKAQLHDAIGLFQLKNTISQVIDVRNILDKVVANNKTLTNIEENMTVVVQNSEATVARTEGLALSMTLGKLSYVPGSSWDPNREYMANTRVELLREIHTWVTPQEGTQTEANPAGGRIVLLTAVAGAGKTTVAHVVAQQWHNQGLLGSSFFFDRDTVGRSSTVSLFSTIAADLGNKHPQLGELIVTAVEADRTVLSAPMSRQFKELVLDPCNACASTFTRSVIIVIDALDEAWDDELLIVLRTGVPRLPRAFHVFLTSRMRPELATLTRMSHVERVELSITQDMNLHDTAMYAREKLAQLTRDCDLSTDWLGKTLLQRFVERAGGLFLWVRVTCAYLANCDDPDTGLRDLLSSAPTGETSAEQKMDALYARILADCDWTDRSFVAAYQRVMGTTIASQTPLSMSAMQELYHEQRVASDRTLHRLSPLLTGMSDGVRGIEPVRVLHQSLRDFLVNRAAYTHEGIRYCITEQDHSRVLGRLCLQYLSRELVGGLPGTGYLDTDEEECPGIPKLAEGSISESLRYACRFWLDHLRDAVGDHKTMEELHELVESKSVLWLELAAAVGQCPSPHGVRKGLTSDGGGDGLWTSAEDADVCQSLSKRLRYEDRREAALDYAMEAAYIYHKLARAPGASYESELASCMHELAMCQSGLGLREEALTAAQESLDLYRLLAAERTSAFTPDLAMSLNNLSIRLSDLGRMEEALAATQEALELYRRLAAERPAVFTPDLAMSLNNLSSDLSDMERMEEALAAIQEALELYRRLAAERPVVYTADLAQSCYYTSLTLFELTHYEEALSLHPRPGASWIPA